MAASRRNVDALGVASNLNMHALQACAPVTLVAQGNREPVSTTSGTQATGWSSGNLKVTLEPGAMKAKFADSAAHKDALASNDSAAADRAGLKAARTPPADAHVAAGNHRYLQG